MIGWSKINERLPVINSNRMLLMIGQSKINERLPVINSNRMLLSMKGYLLSTQTWCCYQWKVTCYQLKQDVVINERLPVINSNRMLLSMKGYLLSTQTGCCYQWRLPVINSNRMLFRCYCIIKEKNVYLKKSRTNRTSNSN
jgi:hypothetical protein